MLNELTSLIDKHALRARVETRSTELVTVSKWIVSWSPISPATLIVEWRERQKRSRLGDRWTVGVMAMLRICQLA